MKKLMIPFLVMAIVFGVVITARADTWTHSVNVGELFGADPGGHIWQGYGSVVYTWDHLTPLDFEVPYDLVISATLSVYVGWVDTFGDDHIDVYGLSLPLTQNTATYNLDIGSLFVSWPNGQNFQVSLTILEDELAAGFPDWGGDIILGISTFNLEYENRVPVPEPNTILLFGGALIGYGVLRKKFKKS